MHEEPITEWGWRPSGHQASFQAQKVWSRESRRPDCPIVQHLYLIHAVGIDHHRVSVIGAAGRGAFGQTGVGGLHDHDLVRLHTGLQHRPQLGQFARSQHGERVALARTEPFAEPFGLPVPGQHMARTEDFSEPCNERVVGHRGHLSGQ